MRLILQSEKSLIHARPRMSEFCEGFCSGTILTVSVFASVAINRVKRLLPNLLATGDDDGVVKVCVIATSPSQLADALSSCGILGSPRLYGHIPITSTSYPTSYGLRIKSILSVRGTYPSSLWSQSTERTCASGDGTLSVIDVRSKKLEPFAHSEDQEDELLSVVSIKKYISSPLVELQS